MKHVKAAFATSRLVDITADSIELFLRDRLRQRIRVKAKLSYKDAQRGRSQEGPTNESLFRGGVRGSSERAMQTTLRYVVRTAENRIKQSTVFAEYDFESSPEPGCGSARN